MCRPTVREKARPSGRHVAHELREHALRQRVGLDGVLLGHLLDRRAVDQRGGDDALEQAGMGQMADALADVVADADGVQRA